MREMAFGMPAWQDLTLKAHQDKEGPRVPWNTQAELPRAAYTICKVWGVIEIRVSKDPPASSPLGPTQSTWEFRPTEKQGRTP